MPFDVQSVESSKRVIFGDTLISGKSVLQRSSIYRDTIKRILDVAFVLIFGTLLLPVMLILCGLIALDGHTPIYAQERVGKGGRIFRIFKLRTMVIDADSRLADHLENNPEARREWHTKQKLARDPRITRVGHFLRKTSADELPQLLNVLLGDMSLVGPRPMMPSQQPLYSGSDYYQLRPGITGPWQVSDRNNCDFCERARFDETYNRTLSFAKDISLLLQTVRVVFRGTGC